MDLVEACKTGNIEEVKKCLGSGSDATIFNQNGYTPLHIVCASNSLSNNAILEITLLLLQSGANPNQKSLKTKRTSLHFAAEHGREKVVKILLDAKADVDATDETGSTPLIAAAQRNGTDEVIAILAQYGANLNACTNQVNHCFTALHYAAREGHYKNISKLVILNANVRCRALFKETSSEATIIDLMKRSLDGTNLERKNRILETLKYFSIKEDEIRDEFENIKNTLLNRITAAAILRSPTIVSLNQNYYFKVTQDGIGRIDNNADRNLRGLYTDNLLSCYGICIIGTNNKISLIHKTTTLSIDELCTEFKWVDAPSKWYIIYNLQYVKPTEADALKAIIEKKLIAENIESSFADKHNSSYVYLNKDGTVDIITKENEYPILLPIHTILRDAINGLNNLFSQPEKAPADRQFIDNKYTVLPKLITDANNIVTLCLEKNVVKTEEIDNKDSVSAISTSLKHETNNRDEYFFKSLKDNLDNERSKVGFDLASRYLNRIVRFKKSLPECFEEKTFCIDRNPQLSLLNKALGIIFYGEIQGNYLITVNVSCHCNSNSMLDNVRAWLDKHKIPYTGNWHQQTADGRFIATLKINNFEKNFDPTILLGNKESKDIRQNLSTNIGSGNRLPSDIKINNTKATLAATQQTTTTPLVSSVSKPPITNVTRLSKFSTSVTTAPKSDAEEQNSIVTTQRLNKT